MRTNPVRKRRGGFTLIELLIVIGLLGALTALVLPSMMADREKALGNICDYNQAGTLRVLKQYQQITGKLPNGMHTGLTVSSGASSASDAMSGMPDQQAKNLALSGSYYTLTASDITALKSAGITCLAYGAGLYYTNPLTESTSVLRVTTGWKDDGDKEYQFNGKKISEYEEIDGAKVLVFYVAPTTDWEAGSGDNSDWSGGNMKISLDLPGKCPVPTTSTTGETPDFAYYMAYIALYTDNAVLSASASGTGVTAPTITSKNQTSVSAAKTAAEDLVSAADSHLTWVGDWATIGTTTSRVANYSYLGADGGVGGGDDVTGTVTFKIADHTGGGTAELVGTSCPECGVLNP